MASLMTTLNISFHNSSSTTLFHNNFRTSFTPKSLCFQPLLSSSSNLSTQITKHNLLHHHHKQKKRGFAIITRAAPTTANLIFAFVFPLTLLLVTIFTSIKIADKLDQDFVEELAINQAIMEGKDEKEDSLASLEEEEPATVTRTRNRPKREA
ncbi:uncharacterized protein LOC113310288 [Papaver somniferum]|uniref:uncharacterized protein LOC113310288 n=1 Tax=Papaver somniferum TaxID=3469 RepID=UPI000E6F815B|nr:uncharacterized protein LOC113310288 [Papaver somniferum]